ncbi:hypothetical protein GF339_13985 [candidate division KSB3 bacterium]|uniref:BLUF domain-containing protein n=1 Tax=candidate division KSB3 bacterium TaxID=2044937 RepID=A0A9D5JXV0_9BACT|nr:hypothetical protein [candidate division KSB3 bacterium]MBD3325691.1 hypothetical protein [candidate division KSB3 bacterium]
MTTICMRPSQQLKNFWCPIVLRKERGKIFMKLYRLIYMSEVAENIHWDDLKDILITSQKNNTRLGITGLLIMSDNKFLQVLEGPGKPLNTLYAKILHDSRHHDSQLLSQLLGDS